MSRPVTHAQSDTGRMSLIIDLRLKVFVLAAVLLITAVLGAW
ncbi:hypothetical protein Mspyr1_54340 (plasmid) [Mycolicibacterium gilvum Spyr1]|uniref:Uncharacterized protein n=1 Tax=Mycolicibacterium gilvum (strain DSM 45189 / LMG 24558 / Spyr1) TaxID=278137 RepID=E6TQ24_MYCSR|nr:hypothetical protein Mspyr1_54340 [Mycolicibacterium gilvum Spyr1]